MICDSHIHFFSPGFFAGLGATESRRRTSVLRIPSPPKRWPTDGSMSSTGTASRGGADRELARRCGFGGQGRGDPSVAFCRILHARSHPRRRRSTYATRALDEGLRTICLFPAMHRYALHDDRVARVFELAAARGGTATVIFVHCGVLSVGVRKKLGLPSAFDMRFGNPLDLHARGLEASIRADRHPALRRGHAARGADAGGPAAPTCISIPRARTAWIKYTPGLTLEQVFQTALMWSGPNDCCSVPIRRSSRAGGIADLRAQKSALDAIGANEDVQAKSSATTSRGSLRTRRFRLRAKALPPSR